VTTILTAATGTAATCCDWNGEMGAVLPKFRKKPVVIEAVQFSDALTAADLFAFLGSFDHVDVSRERILINTLEGVMRADPGDWIVKGVKGEFYPVKPDIFAETYETVT
jgi:hypothetical protein